ncbi:LOW QUALITY PROTEIN: hypothetical protein YC2023_106385 [Brassica napus]
MLDLISSFTNIYFIDMEVWVGRGEMVILERRFPTPNYQDSFCGEEKNHIFYSSTSPFQPPRSPFTSISTFIYLTTDVGMHCFFLR